MYVDEIKKIRVDPFKSVKIRVKISRYAIFHKRICDAD